MGVSKIVREIEGKWVDEWGCVMGKLGNGNGLSGVRELVNWGVFGKWMGMGEFGLWSVMGVRLGRVMIDLLNH